MIFNDTSTNKNGLIQDIEQTLFSQYGAITDNTNKLRDFTNRINRAYDKLATVIMSADNRWQFDDENYTTDLPIGRTNLISGQKDYVMDVEHLRVISVQVKDSAGNLLTMRSVDIHDPEGRAMYDESPTAVEGTPIIYDKFSNVIRLYPTPNYNQTNGLVVHYQRQPSYFSITDTDKKPGVPSLFHRYLSRWASADYAIDKQLNTKNDLFNTVQIMENDVTEWYQRRSKDEQLTLRAVQRHSR